MNKNDSSGQSFVIFAPRFDGERKGWGVEGGEGRWRVGAAVKGQGVAERAECQ